MKENFNTLSKAIKMLNEAKIQKRKAKLHDHFYALDDEEVVYAWIELMREISDMRFIIYRYRILSILLMILSLISLYK